MNANQKTIEILLKIRDQASAQIKSLEKSTGSLTSATNKNLSNMGNAISSLSLSIRNTLGNAISFAIVQIRNLAIAGTTAFTAIAGYGVKTSATLESTRQSFMGLGISVQETNKIMERLKKEAKSTPFEFVGLSQATQLLTSVTKNGDRSIDFLLNIGKSLSAVGKGQAELDRVVVNLQQIASLGRASAMDIKQFAFAGIPIYEMLTQTIGKSGEALEDFISDGGVTFNLLEKMFADAGKAGGRFEKAFTSQAGTFNQLWSNAKDTFGLFASDFVNKTGIFDGAKRVIARFTDWLDKNQDKIINFGKQVKEWLGDRIKDIGKWFDENKDNIKNFFGDLKNIAIEAWDKLKPLVDGLLYFFKDPSLKLARELLFGAAAGFTALSIAGAGFAALSTPLGAFVATLSMVGLLVDKLKQPFADAAVEAARFFKIIDDRTTKEKLGIENVAKIQAMLANAKIDPNAIPPELQQRMDLLLSTTADVDIAMEGLQSEIDLFATSQAWGLSKEQMLELGRTVTDSGQNWMQFRQYGNEALMEIAKNTTDPNARLQAMKDSVAGIGREAKITEIKMLQMLKSSASLSGLPNAIANIKNTLSGAFGINNIKVDGAKANGGLVMSNQSYLVGEKGPEIFTPSTSGNITPNHQIGGGGSVNININGGDTSKVYQAVQQALQSMGLTPNSNLNAKSGFNSQFN